MVSKRDVLDSMKEYLKASDGMDFYEDSLNYLIKIDNITENESELKNIYSKIKNEFKSKTIEFYNKSNENTLEDIISPFESVAKEKFSSKDSFFDNHNYFKEAKKAAKLYTEIGGSPELYKIAEDKIDEINQYNKKSNINKKIKENFIEGIIAIKKNEEIGIGLKVDSKDITYKINDSIKSMDKKSKSVRPIYTAMESNKNRH